MWRWTPRKKTFASSPIKNLYGTTLKFSFSTYFLDPGSNHYTVFYWSLSCFTAHCSCLFCLEGNKSYQKVNTTIGGVMLRTIDQRRHKADKNLLHCCCRFPARCGNSTSFLRAYLYKNTCHNCKDVTIKLGLTVTGLPLLPYTPQ